MSIETNKWEFGKPSYLENTFNRLHLKEMVKEMAMSL